MVKIQLHVHISIKRSQFSDETAFTKVTEKPKSFFAKKKIIGPFIRGKIRRELYHLYEHVLSNKMRLS